MKDTRDFIYTIPSSILFDSSLVLLDIKIYMVIRSFMDTTGEAYASNKWIGKELDVHPNSVSRSISRLVTRGHVMSSEIDGQRYLTIGKSICCPVDKSRGGKPKCLGGVNPSVKGGVNPSVNQLDQNDISSNIINDHVKIEKKRTAKELQAALSADEKYMFERLVLMGMSKHLALKSVSQNNINIIDNIIEAGKANRVKNMGAYINTSLKNRKGK